MTENSSKEKDDITTAESRQINDFDLLKRIITYIQENASAFTFLTTTAIAAGGVMLKVIAYLIEYGKTIYFNVSSLLIDVSEENILYDLFVKGVFALLFILLNLILFILWSGKSKKVTKVVWSLLFLLLPDLILSIYIVFNYIRGVNYPMSENLIVLCLGFLLGCALFFWGIFNGICEYRFISKLNKDVKNKEEKTKKEKRLKVFKISFLFKNKSQNIKKKTKNKSEQDIKNESEKPSRVKMLKISFLVFASLLVVESLLFIVIGYDIAYSQNQFKIINSGDDTYYAVVYENPNRYVITECEIEGGYISFPKRDIQQEIDRDDVEYQWQRLTQKR